MPPLTRWGGDCAAIGSGGDRAARRIGGVPACVCDLHDLGRRARKLLASTTPDAE